MFNTGFLERGGARTLISKLREGSETRRLVGEVKQVTQVASTTLNCKHNQGESKCMSKKARREKKKV